MRKLLGFTTLVVLLIAASTATNVTYNQFVLQTSSPTAVITPQSVSFHTIPQPTPEMVLGEPLTRSSTPTAVATTPPVATPEATSTSTTGSLARSTSSSPSGEAMPTGDLADWHQVFTQDFTSNMTLGNFPGSYYGQYFTVYPDGTRDTAGQSGAPSRYYPSRVASVSNGSLNLYLHTENGTPMAAAILPIIPGNHLYGKYTIRFRSDSLSGFKTAWLLWPDSGVWPRDGEIDFPEGSLSATFDGFVHHQGATSGSDQDAFPSNTTYASWHTASIEWSPNKVSFILDNRVIGTSTTRIPDTPMHWVIQTESCYSGCPPASEAGYLQIDWMAAYTWIG